MKVTIIGKGTSSIALADAMGVKRNLKKADIAIFWGLKNEQLNKDRNYIFRINNSDILKSTANKFKQLEKLQEYGIRTPKISQSPYAMNSDYLGRDFYHSQGTDISFYRNGEAPTKEHDYFIEFIPNCKERRYHVIDGEVVSSCYKLGGSKEGRGAYCKNLSTGWRFKEFKGSEEEKRIAIQAIEALRYNFGAVDLLIDSNNKVYVLEVNTAPGLCMPRLEAYANKLTELAEEIYTGSREESDEAENRLQPYDVCFEMYCYRTVTVDATNEEEAEERAWHVLDGEGDIVTNCWEHGDIEVSETYIVE